MATKRGRVIKKSITCHLNCNRSSLCRIALKGSTTVIFAFSLRSVTSTRYAINATISISVWIEFSMWNTSTNLISSISISISHAVALSSTVNDPGFFLLRAYVTLRLVLICWAVNPWKSQRRWEHANSQQAPCASAFWLLHVLHAMGIAISSALSGALHGPYHLEQWWLQASFSSPHVALRRHPLHCHGQSYSPYIVLKSDFRVQLLPAAHRMSPNLVRPTLETSFFVEQRLPSMLIFWTSHWFAYYNHQLLHFRFPYACIFLYIWWCCFVQQWNSLRSFEVFLTVS